MGTFEGSHWKTGLSKSRQRELNMWRLLAASAFIVGLLLLPARAPASAGDQAWAQFRGQIVISDVLLANDFGSDRVMITSLNRMRRSTVQEATGFWRLHLVAFLDTPAAGEMLHVVARDLTAPEDRDRARRGELLPLRVFETPSDPGQRIVHMNDLVLTEGMGFQRGHEYGVTVENEAEAGGKQDVYAQGVITLR
jgi:hypothetical protein